jgi:signal transduction histidine kinase
VGESVLAVLTLASFRGPRVWSASLVQRLELLGQILANALARQRTDQEIQELLRFEQLVSQISSSLVTADGAGLEPVTRAALAAIGQTLAIDRVALWVRTEERENFEVIHSWAKSGIEPVGNRLGSDQVPWMMAAITRGETVHMPRPEDLPPEAGRDREYLQAQGVRACLALPLAIGGTTVGALSLARLREERAWPEQLVARLRLLGELLAGALARRQADLAQRRLDEELAHATRVATVGEMAASLAHELNQPLCAVLLNAQTAQRLLAGPAPDLEEARAALADIATQTNRANAIIARVRAFVRHEAVLPQSLDLNDLIRETVELTRRDLALRGIGLELDLAEDLPAVLADRVQLQQVLLNLLRNGAEAIEAGAGAVRTLRVRSKRSDGDRVTGRVEDSGPGLAVEDLVRIFQPFYTTKPQGLGLGLAICRSLLTAHGGELTAGAAPLGGACLQFTLPAAPPADPAPASPKHSNQA